MSKKKNPNLTNIIVFLTSVLTFFLLWVFHADKVKEIYVKNILKTDIYEVTYDKNLKLFNQEDLELEKFWEVYNLLKKNYYSLEWIKKDDLVDWAITGMVEAVGDKHSEFFNKKQTEKFNEALSWDFEWIGAVVEKTPIWVKIDRLIKWSPAKKYWLLQDDILIEANGEDLIELDLYDAVDKIKWAAWTKVVLKVLRSWETDILEIEVTRAKIKIPSVESKAFTWSLENIWYIALNMYGDKSSDEFKAALKEFKEKKGIIIDLRDNGGWYLQSAVEILSEFIESWETLVSTRYKNSFMDVDYKSVHFWEVYSWKIVVLINGNSASASEITAWALRDYQKAIIVWEKSYWKWSVQQPFNLVDWSMVKLTIAKWFTPEWINIDEEGITPDIEVNFEKEDYEDKFDRQLERAKEILKLFIDNSNVNKSIELYNEKYKIENENNDNEKIEINSWSLEK